MTLRASLTGSYSQPSHQTHCLAAIEEALLLPSHCPEGRAALGSTAGNASIPDDSSSGHARIAIGWCGVPLPQAASTTYQMAVSGTLAKAIS